jgi:hypothetical protein
MAAKDQHPQGTSKQDHAERAAAALRDNLRKRKAQQRERAGKTETATDETTADEKKRGR